MPVYINTVPGLTGIQKRWLVLLVILSMDYPAWAADNAPATRDSRQVYSSQSPDWLQAVGKLLVPGIKIEQGQRAHHVENCSATLVSRTPETDADVIITAWHCLEHYKDLSQPITFTLLPDSEHPIAIEAYRLRDGGDINADWAILKLYQAIPHEQANAMQVSFGTNTASSHIVMAGYSSDSEKGKRGERLTYDSNCSVTNQSQYSSNSDCLAFKGASGGAVISVTNAGQASLTGVISQGDSNSLSTFVPISHFRSEITHYLH